MRLTSNKKDCLSCGKCEKMLHGFKSEFHGNVFVSHFNFHNRQEVRESIKELIQLCPAKAIELTPDPEGFCENIFK